MEDLNNMKNRMNVREFRRGAKILLTDLDAGRNVEENRKKYVAMCAAALTDYAVMKVLLNTFTRWEDGEHANDPEDLTVRETIRTYVETVRDQEDAKSLPEGTVDPVFSLRGRIMEEMEILTGYTDHFTLHEHILNRKEYAFGGSDGSEDGEKVSIDKLLDDLMQFIFADKDKMIVNTRIQQILEQMPVRMTKQRFYDILSESLALYQGGDLSAAESFADSLRDIAGIGDETSDGDPFGLEELKSTFREVDYKTITPKEIEDLQGRIHEAAGQIEEIVTDRMQLAEIVNDLLILLLVQPLLGREYLNERFDTAADMLLRMCNGMDEEWLPEASDSLAGLVGAQEEAYESLLILEGRLDSLRKELPEQDALTLQKADLLTSDSLFIRLDEYLAMTNGENPPADEASIAEVKERLAADFDRLFSGMDKDRKRGIMARVMGQLPVFFNTQDEIREYFRYTLEHCGDEGELLATDRLVRILIEEM